MKKYSKTASDKFQTANFWLRSTRCSIKLGWRRFTVDVKMQSEPVMFAKIPHFQLSSKFTKSG